MAEAPVGRFVRLVRVEWYRVSLCLEVIDFVAECRIC